MVDPYLIQWVPGEFVILYVASTDLVKGPFIKFNVAQKKKLVIIFANPPPSPLKRNFPNIETQ